jgi:hypothetical protein
MKVFISWSGENSLSHKVALALRGGLPQVIQSIDPYVSSEDINKGTRWHDVVSRQLDETSFGIICVTRANADSRWMNFEAGALSKRVGDLSRVSPLLLDLEPAELVGPLTHFQVTRPQRDDVARLVKSINSFSGEPLSDARVEAAMGKWWPDLDEKLQAALGEEPQAEAEPRRSDDMLKEVLEITRGIQRRIDRPTTPIEGAVNVRTSEQEGYRTRSIYDNIWEILYGADIEHRMLSIHGSTVEVEVYYLADLPQDVKAALDSFADRRGLTINVTTIEHPDPEYIARR